MPRQHSGTRMYPDPTSVLLQSRGPVPSWGVEVQVISNSQTAQPPGGAAGPRPAEPFLLGRPLTQASPDCGFQRVAAGPRAASRGLGEVAGCTEAGGPHPGGMGGGDRGCWSHPWAHIRQGQRGASTSVPLWGASTATGSWGCPGKPGAHLPPTRVLLGSPRPPSA